MKKNFIIALGILLFLNTNLSEAAVSCGIGSSGLFFGTINPLSQAEVASVATINLSCSGGPLTYTIKLTQGNGTILQRLMKSGSNVLKYNLYTSNSYSTILGDGTAGSLAIDGQSITDTTDATYFVFGKVSNIGLSSTEAGTYTDNISVTIIY